MTTIAEIKGSWYVVKSEEKSGMLVWTPISEGFATSEQARTKQVNIIFG